MHNLTRTMAFNVFIALTLAGSLGRAIELSLVVVALWLPGQKFFGIRQM